MSEGILKIFPSIFRSTSRKLFVHIAPVFMIQTNKQQNKIQLLFEILFNCQYLKQNVF